MVHTVERLKRDLHLQSNLCTYWTDSTIVQATSASYKTFVANRVAEIQRLTNEENWRYINATMLYYYVM